LDWEIEFYQRENGEIPVENFLLSLNPKLRAKAYSDILLLKKLGINIRDPFQPRSRVNAIKDCLSCA
jgi:hypothetical protein